MGHQTAEAHSSSLALGCAARNSSGSQTSSTRSLGSPPRLRVTPTETVCKNVQAEVCSLPPFPHLAFPNLSSSPEPCRKAFIISIQRPAPAPLSNKRVHTRCGRRTFWMMFMKNTDSKDGEKNLQMNHPPDLPRKKKEEDTRRRTD